MHHRAARIRAWYPALALALVCGPGARADEAYFLLTFGSQRTPNEPNYSHTWATFVRAVGQGPCLENYVLAEAHTISWLPANLKVRTWALRPECGHNFDLHTTIRYALSSGERVSMWGPYMITRDLYCQALRQIRHLESGEVRYKAVDTGYPTNRVSNCIHAVHDIVGAGRIRIASPLWGESATFFITRDMLPWVLDEDQYKYKWVSTRLGLDCYPIIHREMINPRSGAVRTAVRLFLGTDNPPPSTYGPPR